MIIIRRMSRVTPWLAVDPQTGDVSFVNLVQCLHERGHLRLKTLDTVAGAELFIGTNPSICVGPLEICETHSTRDGMRVTVRKSLSR